MEGTGGFLHPEKIIKQLVLRDNMVVADFGSGHGYFTIPLAKMIPQGEIYALDVLKEALEAIESRAKIEKITNIKLIRCNLENLNGAKLDSDSVDLVVLANILFQTQKKAEIIQEAKRVLKKGGKAIIIDWIKGSSMAPKEGGWLIGKEKVRSLAEETGVDFVKELEMDNQHYGLVFKKVAGKSF